MHSIEWKQLKHPEFREEVIMDEVLRDPTNVSYKTVVTEKSVYRELHVDGKVYLLNYQAVYNFTESQSGPYWCDSLNKVDSSKYTVSFMRFYKSEDPLYDGIVEVIWFRPLRKGETSNWRGKNRNR